jgi:hypothetical protein
MKLAVMISIAVIGAGGRPALDKHDKPGPGRPVAVYYRYSPGIPLSAAERAQGLASAMFANIGITLAWQSGSPSPSETGAVAIDFVAHTPETLKPGALAFALPYEGVHIRIFWDRIQTWQLLAHVIVHEVTHILQGTDHHSGEDIMKAHWTRNDQSRMKVKPLSFTPADVDMIYNGLSARNARPQ